MTCTALTTVADQSPASMHGNHIAGLARQFRHGRMALTADYDEYAEQVPARADPPLSLAELL